MSRTIIVGDVHGCRDELDSLLDYVGFNPSDSLVLVGDLVVRGPDPRGTIALCRKLGAVAVRGNHEDRLLRYQRSLQLGDSRSDTLANGRLAIGTMTRKTAEELRAKDWEYIAQLPLWIDLARHDMRIVHAGLVPGVPIEAQDPRALMYIRSLRPSMNAHGLRATSSGADATDPEPAPPQAHEERGRESWAHSYHHGPHVVFGHNAQIAPEIAECATGIDTGAVYGGRLTAMVLREGEQVPPAKDRYSVLVSVPARRAYVTRSVRAA